MGTVSFVLTVLLTFIFSYFLVSAKENNVPALIWGRKYDNTGSFSSLKQVGSDEFFDHLMKNIHKTNEKSSIVVFLEETLSVEDFIMPDFKGDRSFTSLKDVLSEHKLEYIPSVENPLAALTGPQVKTHGYSLSQLNGNSIGATKIKKHNVVYIVNLEDADSKEDRPQMLQRHDEMISKLFAELSKNNPDIVFVLTGRYSSWIEPYEIIRIRRQANETAPNETISRQATASNGVILETQNALIYSKNIPVLKIDGENITLENPTSGVHDDREKWQRAVFTYVTRIGKVNLRFRFENTSNYYWSLSQVELEDPQKGGELVLLNTTQQISAPYDYSFHTSSPVVFSSGKNSLYFSDMQVQPWKSPVNGMKKFSAAEDDITYFTPAIWSGLIVTGLIGLILIWGLSMILDIRTMDQFDDPKGKTITVNVSD